MAGKRRTPLFLGGAAIFLAFLWLYAEAGRNPAPRYGMFEWDDRTVKEPEKAVELAGRLSVSRWYQEISDELPSITPDELALFARRLHEQEVEVYLLVGSVDWGFRENGKELLEHLETLLSYQDGAGEAERIDGVMLDIEAYITQEWKKDPETRMAEYVEIMKEAYRLLSGRGVRTAICIPRDYDDMGLEAELSELIAEACDEVAVMNYGCGTETEAIRTEVRLARRHKKGISCILEFQEVGKHGLTEEETYRDKGLAAAEAAWDQVQKQYPKTDIIRDYHCADALRQMLEAEIHE